jgi:dUTP pyrophosphatase
MTTLKTKRLHPDAQLPQYATTGAACFDLVAIDDGAPHPTDQHAAIYGTGLAFEIPKGLVLMIYSRSGHGFKDGIRLSNCTGVIDSDYRGEVKVSLRYDGSERCQKLRKGDRIAQAMLVAAPRVELVEANELDQTERGAGGFGSTDVKVMGVSQDVGPRTLSVGLELTGLSKVWGLPVHEWRPKQLAEMTLNELAHEYNGRKLDASLRSLAEADTAEIKRLVNAGAVVASAAEKLDMLATVIRMVDGK